MLLTNEQREELCMLIHRDGLTIKEAARRTGIPYPNAKAVNKTYERERRTEKRHVKLKSDSLPNEYSHMLHGHASQADLYNPYIGMSSVSDAGASAAFNPSFYQVVGG